MRVFAITLIVGLALPSCAAAQEAASWEAGISDNACFARIDLHDAGSEPAGIDSPATIFLGFAILHPNAPNPLQNLLEVESGDMIMQAQIFPSWDFETDSARKISDIRVVLGSEEFPLLLNPTDPKTTFPAYLIGGPVTEKVWSAVRRGQHPEIRFKFEEKPISIPIRGARIEPIAAMLAACADGMKPER